MIKTLNSKFSMTDTKYFALNKQMTSRHLFREINEQTR